MSKLEPFYHDGMTYIPSGDEHMVDVRIVPDGDVSPVSMRVRRAAWETFLRQDLAGATL